MSNLDPLEKFAKWFMDSVGVLGRIPHDAPMHNVNGVTSVTLFRQPPFQVQMFICPPGQIVPEHTHPNVDSIEVYCGGHLRLSHFGKWTQQDTSVIDKPTKDGTSFLRGQYARVHPTDPHGGIAGDKGAIFLSIQHWLNGVQPSCVANDYIGTVMGPDHMAKVTTGEPILKPDLNPLDAATNERSC